MEYGIIVAEATSQRKKPDHKSEMTNQLLFGEIVSIVTIKNEWAEVISYPDNYCGFILKDHILDAEKTKPEDIFSCQNAITSQITKATKPNAPDETIVLPPGSRLYDYSNGEFRVKGQIFFCDTSKVTIMGERTGNTIITYAESLLNTPYLWGGKTPFGMDCSGFVQVVFRMAGIELPRDAWQQAQRGFAQDFASESKPGDLAFFGEENEQITHVGIVDSNNTIIHCSGKVRRDKLDHYGIFDGKRYTHKLRLLTKIKN